MLVAHLQIKHVPEALHTELRRRAEREHVTVRDYVLRLIEADQALPSAADWALELAADPAVTLDRSSADLVREARDERLNSLFDAQRGR